MVAQVSEWVGQVSEGKFPNEVMKFPNGSFRIKFPNEVSEKSGTPPRPLSPCQADGPKRGTIKTIRKLYKTIGKPYGNDPESRWTNEGDD